MTFKRLITAAKKKDYSKLPPRDKFIDDITKENSLDRSSKQNLIGLCKKIYNEDMSITPAFTEEKQKMLQYVATDIYKNNINVSQLLTKENKNKLYKLVNNSRVNYVINGYKYTNTLMRQVFRTDDDELNAFNQVIRILKTMVQDQSYRMSLNIQYNKMNQEKNDVDTNVYNKDLTPRGKGWTKIERTIHSSKGNSSSQNLKDLYYTVHDEEDQKTAEFDSILKDICSFVAYNIYNNEIYKENKNDEGNVNKRKSELYRYINTNDYRINTLIENKITDQPFYHNGYKYSYPLMSKVMFKEVFDKTKELFIDLIKNDISDELKKQVEETNKLIEGTIDPGAEKDSRPSGGGGPIESKDENAFCNLIGTYVDYNLDNPINIERCNDFKVFLRKYHDFVENYFQQLVSEQSKDIESYIECNCILNFDKIKDSNSFVTFEPAGQKLAELINKRSDLIIKNVYSAVYDIVKDSFTHIDSKYYDDITNLFCSCQHENMKIIPPLNGYGLNLVRDHMRFRRYDARKEIKERMKQITMSIATNSFSVNKETLVTRINKYCQNVANVLAKEVVRRCPTYQQFFSSEQKGNTKTLHFNQDINSHIEAILKRFESNFEPSNFIPKLHNSLKLSDRIHISVTNDATAKDTMLDITESYMKDEIFKAWGIDINTDFEKLFNETKRN